MMSARKTVICVLPRTGLGNQLFSLMKAHVFAHLNNTALIITGYHHIRIGPYLRGEKSKRNYNQYFTFQKNIVSEWIDRLKVKKLSGRTIVDEPMLAKTDLLEGEDAIYRFGKVPHWDDYFFQLKNHRKLVIELFWKIVDKRILAKLNTLAAPVIGVHIRMGDFKKLQQHQDFSKVGATRTPEHYFVQVINDIRKVHGSDLAVSVFTDGYKHEFEILFKLPNVTLVEGNVDIVDMLLLSRSKIIVTSAASTFSYWAGFLSEVPVILHPDHIHKPQRIDHDRYEGPMDISNSMLIKEIKVI